MKKIKVYFSSSSKELSVEMAGITDYFLGLNDCFLDKGLLLSVSTGLSGSDIVFFLIDSVASWSDDDFDAALENRKQRGKPEIVVYLKTDETGPQPETAARLMDRLNQEAGCRYNTFGHIDTLKLGVLLQLKVICPDHMDVRLENGKAWQDNTELLSLDKVEMVVGHEELQRLYKERIALKDRYMQTKQHFAKNPDDAAANDAFFEASEQYNSVNAEIRKIEKTLYSMIADIYGQVPGEKRSKRQMEAYLLIGRGKYEDAKKVLSIEKLIDEGRQNDEMFAKVTESAKIIISEQMQLKEINVTLSDWDGVDTCFRSAVRLEERSSLPKKATLAYTQFLSDQNRASEGVVIAERLLGFFNSPLEAVTDIEKGQLFKTLGKLYDQTQRLDESESMYNAAVDVYRKLADRDPEAHKSSLAGTYNELARMLWFSTRLKEAAETYTAALDIWTVLAERDPVAYEPFVCKSHHNLGIVNRDMNRLEQSEKSYRTAMPIYQRLIARDSETFELDYARCCASFGYMLTNVLKMEEAEALMNTAVEVYERLAGQNPGAHEPEKASVLNMLGELHMKTQQYEESERELTETLEIRLRYAVRDPELFEPFVALTHMHLGLLYMEKRDTERAERAFKESLELWSKVDAACPDRYELEFGITYRSLGEMYIRAQRADEAEEPLGEALRLFKKMSAEGEPGFYEPELSEAYFQLCLYHKDMGRATEAENAGRIALRLFKKYSKDNPTCAEGETKTIRLLESLYDIPIGRLRESLVEGEPGGLFTPEEKEIALLLTEGLSHRDITRKLNISAVEFSRRAGAIREKVSGKVGPDPVIDAVTHEYALTRREADMLRYLRQGAGNDIISAELYLSEETVRTHVRNVLKKLSLENRQDIPAWLESYMNK